MQTPKSSIVTKVPRKLKNPGSDASAPSPKVVGRRSPRSPAVEKKNPAKVSNLESQLAQLQEELKKVKNQLASSESLKRRAQLEAEEAKKQLVAMSEKLEESEKQLLELSDSEDARIQELRKISQDRDRAWQSELEAVQKQHGFDSAALASAMNEIQKLKVQLDRTAGSEANQARHAESAHVEIQSLRVELTETLKLVEKLRNQLNDSKKSEARAAEEASKAQKQIEVAKMTEKTLRSEGLKALEAQKSLSLELERSKDKVVTLEKLVNELQNVHGIKHTSSTCENGVHEELKTELSKQKLEASQLRAALEVSERRYQEEYIQSTLQIRNAYELVEQSKAELIRREAEWEAKLKAAKADLDALKEKTQTADRKCQIEAKLRESESTLVEIRASLIDKETELKSVMEENEMLKSEMKRRETNDEALALEEAWKNEALVLGDPIEEADESSRKAAHVAEQLEAAQSANSEMESELRRLKVQADQWRKAAEAAAAILSTGKYMDRTGSLDHHGINGRVNSAFSEDSDDDSPKKKNGNMLKKIGVLLKKGQR